MGKVTSNGPMGDDDNLPGMLGVVPDDDATRPSVPGLNLVEAENLTRRSFTMHDPSLESESTDNLGALPVTKSSSLGKHATGGLAQPPSSNENDNDITTAKSWGIGWGATTTTATSDGKNSVPLTNTGSKVEFDDEIEATEIDRIDRFDSMNSALSMPQRYGSRYTNNSSRRGSCSGETITSTGGSICALSPTHSFSLTNFSTHNMINLK